MEAENRHMQTIRGVLKDGKIVTAVPDDWRDGLIVVVNALDGRDPLVEELWRAAVNESDTSAEGISRWIEWSQGIGRDCSIGERLQGKLESIRVGQMSSIQAVVRNRRIEVPAPEDLPDGTRVVITSLGKSDEIDEEWERSPEGIQTWMDWLDNLEPFMSPEEQVAFEQALKEQKQWELAHADERAEKLRRLFDA